MRPEHNTGSFMPYSLRLASGFFYVPLGCENSRVVRRGLRFIVLIREDLKVFTFSSVVLRPRVLVRPESNSRPPAWQPDVQPTEPPVRGLQSTMVTEACWCRASRFSFHYDRGCSWRFHFVHCVGDVMFPEMHLIRCGSNFESYIVESIERPSSISSATCRSLSL